MAEANAPASLASNVGRGIALVLLANLLFSFVDTSTKWLIAAGLAVLPLAFIRYAMHFAITLVERTVRQRAGRAGSIAISTMPSGVMWLILLRSFCIVSATLANFVALGHLSLTVSSSILYLSPVFICLFAKLILGETVMPRHWGAIALGMAGALIILWPFGEPINWYAVLMLYPAMAFALYQVLTRRLASEVRPGVLQLYTGGFGTLVLLPFAIATWTAPATPLDWTLFLAIGAFAWAGHEALTRAHAHAQASTLAPFGYSFIVYLTIAGIVVFDDVPQLRVFLGATFIFAAGMMAWLGDRHKDG